MSLGLDHQKYVDRIIKLANKNVEEGGRPFACLIVRTSDGAIISEGCNRVAQTHNPTLLAENVAISEASKKIQTEHFEGYTFYILTYPCPMCMAAMYYCSPDCVVFVTTRELYSVYYKDDRKYFELNSFYQEIGKLNYKDRNMPMLQVDDPRGIKVYEKWNKYNQSKL